MTKAKIKMITDDYKEPVISELADKKMAAMYLQPSLEEYEKDGDAKLFLHSLRYVAEAQGGIAKLAKKTKLNVKVYIKRFQVAAILNCRPWMFY